MATKLTGWTARRPVKICCVILIPILLFVSMLGGYELLKLDYDGYANIDLLFTDLDNDDYFFDSYISDTLYHAYTLFWLFSEENIRDMGCLEWQKRTYEDFEYYYDDYADNYEDTHEDTHEDTYEDNYGFGEKDADDGFLYSVNKPVAEEKRRVITVEVYDLVSTNRGNQWHWGPTITAEEFDTTKAQQMAYNAILQQISEYYSLKKHLDEMPGLSFLVTDGEKWFGNVPSDAGVEFFRRQPVYWTIDFGSAPEQSRSSNRFFDYFHYGYDFSGYGSDLSCFIAFSDAAVSAQNSAWKAARSELWNQLAVIAIPVIVAFACFVTLLAGAGRKHGSRAGAGSMHGGATYEDGNHGGATDTIGKHSSGVKAVHFMLIDKPWLDISLCVLAVYLGFALWGFIEAVQTAWRYSNDQWIIALCAALSVFAALPVLWWLLSFAKRCKAGKFWRHSFLYTLVHWCASAFRRVAASLWAGVPLTLKAISFGAILLVIDIICIAAAASRAEAAAILVALVTAAAATFGLLRYSRRLHLVELGARAASGGQYDDPIAVSGGELGRIAASINNISDGINIAVGQRMKSERMKTELITNISHDIRTPLTSLITYSDLLKSEGLDNERAPEYLDILIQKSARLKTLTDDLFEASKAASGDIEVHVEDLDLADFLRQALGELDEKIRASQLDFRLGLPEHAPVRADGKLLWRVVDNLLSNVFKYALSGSRVYIDVGREEGWFRLDIKNISDRPLNVDPGELTERFKRGDEARSGEGSGLGLSIAQSFVLSQGGRFELSIDGDLFKASLHLPVAE